MNRQLLEIENKIESHLRAILDLQMEKRTIIQSSDSLEIPLVFDDIKRTIRWYDTSIKLGIKSYRFIKTLWLAPNHRLKFIILERKVWKLKKALVKQEIVKKFLYRLKKKLKSASFPYKICSLKNCQSKEISGYGLKCPK